MTELKKMYKTIMDDDFPDDMTSPSENRSLSTASVPGRSPTIRPANSSRKVSGMGVLYNKLQLQELTDKVSVKYIPDEYFEFKARIHDRLLDLIDLSLIDKLDRETLSQRSGR